VSRPRLKRKIGFDPNITYFKPVGIPMWDIEVVELSLEEMESFRLRHVYNMDQQEAADKMNTSQSTFQRILYRSYEKIADALVTGKAIKIVKN